LRQKLAQTFPTDPETKELIQYPENFMYNINYDAKIVPKDQIESVLQQWKLPDEVKNRFRAIAYTPSTEFITFNFYDFGGMLDGIEYAGAAKYDPSTNTVDMAYIRGSVQLNCIVGPMHTMKILIWCQAIRWPWSGSIDPAMLARIHEVLEYADSYLMWLWLYVPPFPKIATQTDPKLWLKEMTADTCINWDPVAKEFNNSKSNFTKSLRDVTLNGFENFVTTSEMTGLKPQFLDAYIKKIVNNFNLTSFDAILLTDAIKENIKEPQDVWVAHHLFAPINDTDGKFIAFFTRFQNDSVSDWIIIALNKVIKVGKYTLEYRIAKSIQGGKISPFDIMIDEFSTPLKKDDIDTIFDYLYIASFHVLARYFGMYFVNPNI
jgi:hypothetical protein